MSYSTRWATYTSSQYSSTCLSANVPLMRCQMIFSSGSSHLLQISICILLVSSLTNVMPDNTDIIVACDQRDVVLACGSKRILINNYLPLLDQMKRSLHGLATLSNPINLEHQHHTLRHPCIKVADEHLRYIHLYAGDELSRINSRTIEPDRTILYYRMTDDIYTYIEDRKKKRKLWKTLGSTNVVNRCS